MFQSWRRNGSGSDVIAKVLSHAKDAPAFRLGDGAVQVGDGLVKASPVVADGKVSLSFISADSPTEFALGIVAEGLSNTSAGPMEGLNWFVDQVNTAVANAYQSIA